MPKRQKKALESGWSILEMIVVLVIIGLIGSSALNGLMPIAKFSQRYGNEQIMMSLAEGFEHAYRINSGVIDTNSGPVLTFPSAATITSSTMNAGRCTTTASDLAPIAQTLPGGVTLAHRDGFNQPICVMVSPRLTGTVRGLTIHYHQVAIVSTGLNGVLDASVSCTTGLVGGGGLRTCGDDFGRLVDGFAIQSELYTATLDKVRRIADAMESYFRVRYQADPSRDASVDYFGNNGAATGRWDIAGVLPISNLGAGCAPVPLDSTGAHSALGLALDDITDAFGNIIRYDNCSASVRSPDNPTVTQALPPYTAVVSTTLPSGAVIAVTAMGSY